LPFFDPRVAALVLGLMGLSAPPPPLPATAVVTVEALEVFDEPDERTFASGQLARGDRVVVRAIGNDGWLTIDPPPQSFDWIDGAAIAQAATGSEARVALVRTQVRSGIPGARMPGPPRGYLARGTTVRLLSHPPLTLGRGSSARTWRAIVPTLNKVGHIRAEGVEWVASPPHERPQEARASFAADTGPDQPPAAIAAEIARIETSHRSILRGPIDQWRLKPIQARYDALRKRANDPASEQAIGARLALVAKHAEAAKAARQFEMILERSRARDRKLALYLRRVVQQELPRERPYDAKGLIQPSSREVDGQRVYALIGPDGNTQAYLDIPAGLNPAPLVARRVGVRGKMHYDENLRARLIAVQDLDPLDIGR
jgi:hypothetical protein